MGTETIKASNYNELLPYYLVAGVGNQLSLMFKVEDMQNLNFDL